MGKGQWGTSPWRGALVTRKAGSRLGLPFGPSLRVQMLHSFQLEGAKSLLIT